jgi:chromosome segregation ATPase
LRQELLAERVKADKLKHEQNVLREQLEGKEESFREISKRLKWVEESAVQNTHLVGNPNAEKEMAQLRQEAAEQQAKVQRLEEENASLLETHKAKVAELTGELDKVKADLARRLNHSKVNNSVFDGDDLALLMVENENLKKEIKVLKNDTMKQNEKDKMVKRTQEKEAEIAILRDRNGELESEVVGLSGEDEEGVGQAERGHCQRTDQP